MRRSGTAGSSTTLWTGALFAVGSVCFALGSVPAYFETRSDGVVAWTFFVGSIFFTSAAALQYRSAGRAAPPDGPHGVRAVLRATRHPDDRWAAAVQLVGTVCFNLSTFAAIWADDSVRQERRLVWAPDVAGSICFLVASIAAWSLAGGRDRASEGPLARFIAGLNLGGSIAFGAAAVAARLLITDGEPANISLVNLGTFVGAVCFFVGAVLLPVDAARSHPAVAT